MSTEIPDLTLRDWFAGQALMGLLPCKDAFSNPVSPDELAGCSFMIADAMLAEREKQKQMEGMK